MGGGPRSGASLLVFVEPCEKPVDIETVEEIDFRIVGVSETVDTEFAESFFGVSRTETLVTTVEAMAPVASIAGEVHRHQRTTSAMKFERRRRPAAGLQLYSDFRGCLPNSENGALAAKEAIDGERAISHETTVEEVRPPRFERGTSRSTVDCSTSLS